ncbi:MAG: phenylalanine--tRNA ligase subunit beta, partial [Patescibacteria group bacterium]|nr:phenylalanine--tRNA ligase subunit beta [Patescibacteria group bacterium]
IKKIIMIFSYNWLKSFFDKGFPDAQKLTQVLTMRAFEVEEIKKIDNDWAMDISVLPNRGADCFSHIGMARECGAILGLQQDGQGRASAKIGRGLSSTNSVSSTNSDNLEIEVREPKKCLRYSARVMSNVKIGQSPKYIQERLKLCNLRPINNVVDFANYAMLETGQPLHIFDFDKIDNKKIIVRKARKGEKMITLDNEEYNLDENMLVIADAKAVLAIAGIKGGKKAEIDANTKTIVLESANFDYQIIKKASKKLGLKTDASWRFEHNISPDLTELGINRLTNLIQETANGKITQTIDYYPKKIARKKVKLNLNYVEKLLGARISKKEIIKILKSLGFVIINNIIEKKEILVEAPIFRTDISIQEDLIEEIGRIYGYEKIEAKALFAVLSPCERNENVFYKDKIKNIMKEFVFVEARNSSFVSFAQVSNFNVKKESLIEIENPVNVEQRYLRNSLVLNLLENVRYNFKYFDEIKFFEIGKKFNKNLDVKEKMGFVAVIARKEGKDEFYEIKGVVDLLLNKLGISDIRYKDVAKFEDNSILQQGRQAEIRVNNTGIGFLGEISEMILRKMKIQGKVVIFDIDFEKLVKLCSEEQIYRPVSLYPSALRDIAILVPKRIKVVDVLNKINAIGRGIIVDIDLFDIYENENLAKGKKNFAFHIVYQAKDRTLTTQEIDETQNKIIKVLEQEDEWEVRR